MQILIGSAKLMTGGVVPRLIAGGTDAAFQRIADGLAMRLSGYTADELASMLRCNASIARENWFRYRRFLDPATRRPALFGYEGMVFQKIEPSTMTDDDLAYANQHLFIASFLYGLLRPLDLINPYRLEGDVRLPSIGHQRIFDFWKPILTDWFIERVKADDGVLVNLASNEFREIFDWEKVEKSLTVITPRFRVEKGGALKTVTTYAKMCRGAMTGWILRRRLTTPEQLREFAYDGFRWEKDWDFNLRP